MAQNIGEEIAGAYLRIKRNCDFIEFNLYTTDVQGEIDVVGVNTSEKKVYICEVAIHLPTGLQYVKDKRPDNINRFFKKFEKDFHYINKRFDDRYEKIFMLWSPIVKNQKGKDEYNQIRAVNEVKKQLKGKFNFDLQLIINEEFEKCLQELREYAGKQTEELKISILRFMQIEEKLKWHNTKTKLKNEKELKIKGTIMLPRT